MRISVTFPSDPAVREHMVLDKQLGQGKFKVFLAKSLSMDVQYALKIFSRDFALRSHYYREKEVIANLEHRNIIKYIPIHSHNFRMEVILSEFLPNGDMFDFVTKGYLTDEKLMRTYFYQLIEGLDYLHSQDIAHLDIKLENLLLDENYVLKIIDFDQAQRVTDTKLFSRGTTNYRAPELRNNKFGDFKALDIYAAGIVLFAFKACEYPFVESDDNNVKEVIHYETFVNNNQQFWRERAEKKGDKDFFSQDFIDLINGMLEENPTRRFTIEDVKRSQWYNGPIYDMNDIKSKILSTNP